MSNMFSAPFEIQIRYDLKGSTLGRLSTEKQKKDRTRARKDLDWLGATEAHNYEVVKGGETGLSKRIHVAPGRSKSSSSAIGIGGGHRNSNNSSQIGGNGQQGGGGTGTQQQQTNQQQTQQYQYAVAAKSTNKSQSQLGQNLASSSPATITFSNDGKGEPQTSFNPSDQPNWVVVGEKGYKLLTEQLRRDAMFLASCNIIDYSILIGIHHVAKEDEQDFKEALNAIRAGQPEEMWDEIDRRLIQGGSLQQVEKEIMEERNKSSNSQGKSSDQNDHKQNLSLLQQQTGLFSNSNQGGIQQQDQTQRFIPYHERHFGGLAITAPGTSPKLVFLGVIDILTNYGFRKRLEHGGKACIHPRKWRGVSCCPPVMYAERFIDFMENRVFIKNAPEKKSKRERNLNQNGGNNNMDQDGGGGGGGRRSGKRNMTMNSNNSGASGLNKNLKEGSAAAPTIAVTQANAGSGARDSKNSNFPRESHTGSDKARLTIESNVGGPGGGNSNSNLLNVNSVGNGGTGTGGHGVPRKHSSQSYSSQSLSTDPESVLV